MAGPRVPAALAGCNILAVGHEGGMKSDRTATGEYLLAPKPELAGLTRRVSGIDHDGVVADVAVVEERPLTIFLNSTEIVTAMTIGDHPEHLATGFLHNQGMLNDFGQIEAVDFDPEAEAVVVRTATETDLEDRLRRKTRTSGCAVGTVFGDLMEIIEGLTLPEATVRTSWLYDLAKRINTTPSLYLEAGAIHGTVLCRENRPLVYMEDVGRHNAVDKVAGWMLANGEGGADKILYTTGRLTSEMVLKAARMGVPVLASRSGFTAWGVELAQSVNLTLIGRMRGRRFMCLSGQERLVRDADAASVPEEDRRFRRKASQ